jgi:hypothetical protein
VTANKERLGHIDDAIARFEQALEALRQIPKDGHGVTVNGLEHELIALSKRLQTLRDEVTGGGDRAEKG